jgi:hypothetical protein
MQRRLHRGGRDPIRIDHPGLDRENDADGYGDRDGPVDRDADRAREALGEPMKRVPQI